MKFTIKAWCAIQKITMAELAKKAGVGTSTLSCWLSGKRSPSIRSLQKVADALGITIDQIEI